MRGQLRDELYTRHKVGATRQLLSIQGNSNGLFGYVLFGIIDCYGFIKRFSDFEFIGFLLGGAKRDRDVLNRTKKMTGIFPFIFLPRHITYIPGQQNR